jgi:hypothetical protein
LEEEPRILDFMKALTELFPRFDHIYILVDGLDESLKRYNLLHVLAWLNESQFDNVKILTMSREEFDIKYAMKDKAQVISLSNSYVDEDIVTFVRQQFSENARLRRFPVEVKQEIEAAIAKGAHGM